ncbi:hypothetical protein BCR44DRAFT_1424071 [Catenaria anguillulae PL171]|uniref:Uncharacterized protein n=1 Tax=Catenaria anguillulae PL171 TaxID=765915 RepID=A0A1Y2I245_9FUNG|nr:hypothetical protein BCR44DRAFT_1424071 [Catenaria anguillulae PL171]
MCVGNSAGFGGGCVLEQVLEASSRAGCASRVFRVGCGGWYAGAYRDRCKYVGGG